MPRRAVQLLAADPMVLNEFDACSVVVNGVVCVQSAVVVVVGVVVVVNNNLFCI